MDWLQIIATDSYWFQGLFLGGVGYAIFFEWKFVAAWFLGWLFIRTSDNAFYVPYTLGLLLVFIWYTMANIVVMTGGRK